jgi:PAS domain S-box-containing protein
VNREHFASSFGETLSASGPISLLSSVRTLAPASDESFQKLLQKIAAKASGLTDSGSLIQFFCQSTQEFFQVSTVSFWRCQPDAGPTEAALIGEYAAGGFAERVMHLVLRKEQSPVTTEAVRQRRTIFTNRLDSMSESLAADLGAQALMASAIIVGNEVVGAITFLHDSDDHFFNEDISSKATILAGQLGSLLEALRLNGAAREEHRRAEILADVAHVLHGTPDVSAVIEALADRLRLLLRTQLVCVLLKNDGPFELRAVSAETPQIANLARARHDRQTLRFAANLAQRAVTAGEPISLSIGAEVHSLGNLAGAGMLIAAPLRTSRTQGAILVYPRQDGVYSAEERALVSAIAGFGAVAVAHAELYSTAHAQAHELHQLLEISSSLSSSRDLDHFLQSFVVHAADFLGYGRCFIGLLNNDQFKVQYAVERGESRRVDTIFPEGVATQVLRGKEVFSTNDVSSVAGVNPDVVVRFKLKQILAVPLLGTSGELLGMFGVLDRLDGSGISHEDIRRARSLSNQVAVVLEVAHNLHLSQQHRRRAEALIELAREIDGTLLLPEFSRRFVRRAAELTGSSSSLLTVFQDGRWQAAAVHPLGEKKVDAPEGTASQEPHHFPITIPDSIQRHEQIVIFGPAADLLGAEAATALQWTECTLVRLTTANGTLAGILALSGRPKSLSNDSADEDRVFLETMAGHAAMALENARLFTRVEQANRHWMAIFDAITDFIVVHDQHDKVLRVNRSLAAMIGVPPAELIGVDMRALMALTSEAKSYSCPFCRSMADDSDEFVHPVFDRTYLVSTSRIHDGADERTQTIHVLKDITDRREAERRYRELFDNIQEGLFFSTPSGRFVEVNDAMVRMLGYSGREELLQIDIPTQLYFSADQRERHSELMQEHGSLRNFEATLRRKNGSPIHVLINAFGLYDHTGQLTQIRGLMLDVTGIRTYQSELHRERDFSAKILGNTQSLVLVADTAGLVSYANRRWYDAGFEQRELLGRPLLELAAPGFVRPLSDALQSTINGQQVDNLELQFLRASGPAGKFSANLSPMRDEQGTITSIVAVLTDITDSAVLRDKLVHAEKMAAVGQLVSGVAHEVNNPLTAILGFADLLMGNPELPENARKDLRVILQEAQRTKQIVQNLLSFARQMPPQRIAVQLNQILRRTVQLRSYDFNSHGIEIIEHLDAELPEVLGDAHQLQQVFLNILNNAYDAVHEVGRPARIEIMSTKAGESVEVSFRDNGNGISHPDKIFDPFFTTKEIGKGTGLGLSICYGIVKEHGGEILCHNNHGGQGATFIVRLPGNNRIVSLGVAAGGTPK